MNHCFAFLAAAMLLLSVEGRSVSAEVRISGNGDNVVVEARNATMPEVLTGLQAALHVKIRLVGSTPRQFTGSYTGSLRRVLSRLLDGTSYIVNRDPDGMSIIVVGGSATRLVGQIVPPTSPAATALAAIKVAAQDADTARVQGWVPTEDPFKAYIMKSPATTAANAATEQAQPAGTAGQEAETNNSVQGWVPIEDPLKADIAKARATAARSAATGQVPPAATVASEAETNSSVQGWIPTEDPFNSHIAKPPSAAPRTDNGQAQPAADKFAAMITEFGGVLRPTNEPMEEMPPKLSSRSRDGDGAVSKRQRLPPSLQSSFLPTLAGQDE